MIAGSNAQAWFEKCDGGLKLHKVVNRNHNLAKHKEGILKSKFKDYIPTEDENKYSAASSD